METFGKMLLLKFCRALIFLFLFRNAAPASAGAGAEQTDLARDAEALLEMKESFVGSGGSLQSWTKSTRPCNWTGINCSVSRIHESSHGSGSSLRVTELALKNVSLLGSFSPAVGRLSALTSLDLSSTGLTGSIPEEVWNLTRLTVLRLKKNGLSGKLPPDALKRFSELRILDLSDNLLTGGIPDVCHLQSLTYLSLAGNSFDGWLPENMFHCMDFAGNSLNGSIPTSFPSNVRPTLVYLNVSHNRLEGGIPRDLAALPLLKKLDLSWNLLSGEIPEETGQLAQLHVLILAQNRLTGRIPEQLGNCTRLAHLNLAHNNLSGKIPGQIGNLRRLTFLNLGTNSLSGPIPESLSNLNGLVTLVLRGNELSGEIPNFLGELSNLEMLDLGMNLLWGKIPKAWRGTQSKLQSILFDGNAVNGKIPSELGLITGLKVLNLNDNALRGPIPPGLGAAANLTNLLLGGNKLSGTIPRELGKLVHLQELNLSSNFITGRIPSEFRSLENLEYLQLKENNLTGDIPKELCSCLRLKYLSLPRNQLSGQIPSGLGNLSELQTILDLSSNNLSDTIPLELLQLTKLEALNLSRNSLSGPVSGFLLGIHESFSLRQLDLSFNDLQGEIPSTDFTKRLNASSFLNNKRLCGSPLNVSCPLIPSAPDISKQSAGVSKTAILGFGIAVASLTVGLLLLAGGMRTCIQYCKRGPSKHEVGGRGTAKSVFHGFTFSGILWERDLTFSDIMEATDDLNPDRQVGSGSFGPVYKAVMPDGEILAVKALKLEHEAPVMPHDKKTITAIVNLCKVRHRHLLRLLGFCAHKGRSLLIYEYMQNGSLWDHLHGACVKLSVSGHQTFWSSPEPDSSILDWPHRYDIALGTAKALAYLHHDCVPRILHGDIKSTNILLDTHMIPYVGDFGLVELLPAGSSDSQAASSLLPGSRGYTAPEYEYTGTLSEEGDVYSFGVLLMEMITGRTAADCGFPDGIPTLVGWLRYCRTCRLSIEMVFDNRLQILISDLERYEMLLVLKIAYMCTNDMPCKRPSMRNVVNLLKEVKRQSMTAGECFSLFATKSLADILPPGGVGEFESRALAKEAVVCSDSNMCDTKGSTGNWRLDLARLFIRSSHSEIDPALPDLLSVLQSVGASECWHKHGTFFEHLLHVYQILKLWNVPDAVARCGLFHSSYSNSYVNLAIFKPNVERQRVRDLVGDVAEELIHLFCIVPRQELIFNFLLFNYTDEQLRDALKETDGYFDKEGNVKVKTGNHSKANGDISAKFEQLNTAATELDVGTRTPFLPAEGITVKHIRTGEDLQVSRHLIAIFLTLTMADFIDQLYSWQDGLFGNEDGKLEFKGNGWTALWPGDGKPGLWMSSISRMGVLLNILVREERLEAALNPAGRESARSLVDDIQLVLPPVFNTCSVILPPSDQIRARDLYHKAMSLQGEKKVLELAEPLLKEASLANPWIAEPRLVLAQIYLSTGRHEDAESNAQQGLQLLLEWGTNWDKKMTWEGWIAWARVLLQNAREKQWPSHSWGIINLGLVK